MRAKAAATVTTLLAAAAIAGCGGGSDGGISDQAHTDYVAGCTDGGTPEAACECLYEEITTTQGIDTDEKFKALIEEVDAASQSADVAAAVPSEFREASLACKDLLQ